MNLCDGVFGGGPGVEGNVLTPTCLEEVLGVGSGVDGGVLALLSLISSLMSPFGLGIVIACFEASSCD